MNRAQKRESRGRAPKAVMGKVQYWTDWARITLVEVLTHELRRTRRKPDWTSVGEKLAKIRAEEDEEGSKSWFERKGLQACQCQLRNMVHRRKYCPEGLSAPVLARLGEFLQLRQDVAAAKRRRRPRKDGDHGLNFKVAVSRSKSDTKKAVSSKENNGKDRKSSKVVTAQDMGGANDEAVAADDHMGRAVDNQLEEYWTASDSFPSPSAPRDGKESDPSGGAEDGDGKGSKSKTTGCGSREVRRKRERLLLASSPPLHTEGRERSNPSLDLGKLEQTFKQQKSRSRFLMDSLFRGLPKARTFIERFITVSTTQSVAEREDSGRHPGRKRMKVLRPNCGNETLHEMEWQSTQDIIRYRIMHTFERFDDGLAALFQQTNCKLQDLEVPTGRALQRKSRKKHQEP